MKILVCEAGKHPAVRDIEHTLKNLQSVVGGYIQALYPYEEMVSVVCNEDGIALNLSLNRILEGYGVIRGTFFLCGLEHATFSNVEHLSLDFVKYTLDPWLVRWEQGMQKALLSDSEKGQYFVKFNVDGLLRGDYASRMQGYATARQNGWMSANDIRELEDMNMIPEEEGGDLYVINGSMSRLSDAGIAYSDKNGGEGDETSNQ